MLYLTGCKVYDQRIGQLMVTHKKMNEVQHVKLLLSKKASEWACKLKELISADREKRVQQFSDIIEAAEYRRDAQMYCELEFSLPQELSDEQNIVLANFHFDIDEEAGERKPHCHALLLARRLTNEGLVLKKERTWTVF